jgi:hypothetical protein
VDVVVTGLMLRHAVASEWLFKLIDFASVTYRLPGVRLLCTPLRCVLPTHARSHRRVCPML